MKQKVLTGDELTKYFEEDAEVLEQIKSGEVVAAVLEYDLEEEWVRFATLNDAPEEVNFSNINMWHEDDFEAVLDTGLIPETIDKVMTISEAAEKYDKAVSTLRRNFARGASFKRGVDVRKSGDTWLVTKEAMDRVYTTS